MSQLVVPGRNAARQAKKLKEIRKVKHAIQWHEKERKKRQELKQEQWDSKQAVIQRIMWENEHVHQVRKKALANAKEDWKLGPLRPNRAIGPGADKYGALTGSQMQKPEIPTRTQKNRNETRAKKGLELEYPLVVKALGAKDKDPGKKYFPIVKDDRVAILKGKDQGKIGVVQEIIERTHEVIIKGLNMVCTTYATSIRAKLLTAPSNTTTLMSSPKLAKKWVRSTKTKCPSPWITYAS
jgi:large subunit ribosomal protein L24